MWICSIDEFHLTHRLSDVIGFMREECRLAGGPRWAEDRHLGYPDDEAIGGNQRDAENREQENDQEDEEPSFLALAGDVRWGIVIMIHLFYSDWPSQESSH